MSLNQLAKTHGISKASVCRVLREQREAVSGGFILPDSSRIEPKEVVPPISMA